MLFVYVTNSSCFYVDISKQMLLICLSLDLKYVLSIFISTEVIVLIWETHQQMIM